MEWRISSFLLLISYLALSDARIHKIHIKVDTRSKFSLSTFGYMQNGELTVNISGFTINELANGRIGFTLDRSKSSGMAEYLETHEDTCIFDDQNLTMTRDVTLVVFRFFLSNSSVNLKRTGDGNRPQMFYLDTSAKATPDAPARRRRDVLSDLAEVVNNTQKAGAQALDKVKAAVQSLKNSVTKSRNTSQAPESIPQRYRPCHAADDTKKLKPLLGDSFKLDVTDVTIEGKTKKKYGLVFKMLISNKSDTGLYSLYFHNCFNIRDKMAADFDIEICEKNGDNFLSAGQVPLPTVYSLLGLVFLLLGTVWLYALCRANKQDVYKLHYIMLTVVWVKSLSLMFHAINYHFISKEGMHEEAWAVLYYVVHLLKGALLFSTIVLIGAGWIFLRHVLSARVKQLFLVIIPLQILSNTASIILEEKDASSSNFTAWSQVFILVDLVCCGAILFPVVWSIRHLQEGAQVDGKEALNLSKLKLFRHFYIMVVCYIYFTRIIVYLLKVTVPFQFMWLNELFKEGGTLTFFIMTGIKFQPADNNPYLQVPQDSDEEEMEEVITTTGETESLRRVNRHKDDEDTTGSVRTEPRHETSLEFD